MSDIEDDFDTDDLIDKSRATNLPTRRRSSSAHDVSPARNHEPALPPSQDAFGAVAKNPIPAKLLNALLHEGFEDKEMRIGKEAMAVTGKYIETFVREALARAMIGRQTEEERMGGADDGFLQVSHGFDALCSKTWCANWISLRVGGGPGKVGAATPARILIEDLLLHWRTWLPQNADLLLP